MNAIIDPKEGKGGGSMLTLIWTVNGGTTSDRGRENEGWGTLFRKFGGDPVSDTALRGW